MIFCEKYDIIACNKWGGRVIKYNKELLLKEDSYNLIKNYKGVYNKFSNRFPVEYSDRLLDWINNDYVSIFDLIMKPKLKKEYIENFYSNLSNSKIIKNKLLLKLFSFWEYFGGNYFTKRNNYLVLGDKELLEKNNACLTPYHELLHLLSTRIDDKHTVRIGLQINDYGISINEGYTELLTKRYFNNFSIKDYTAYPNFVWYMEMIEEIVGKDRLEDLYYSSNQEGLSKELTSLSNEEDIINLFNTMDELFFDEKHLYDIQKKYLKLNKEVDLKTMNEYYESNKINRDYIFESILKMYKNKQLKLLKNKIIDQEMYDKRIKEFVEKNLKKKEKTDQIEDLYQEYFKNEIKTCTKK